MVDKFLHFLYVDSINLKRSGQHQMFYYVLLIPTLLQIKIHVVGNIQFMLYYLFGIMLLKKKGFQNSLIVNTVNLSNFSLSIKIITFTFYYEQNAEYFHRYERLAVKPNLVLYNNFHFIYVSPIKHLKPSIFK